MALGLVTVTLYFASSMSYELRASDNRVSSLAADQAVEAGARYVGEVLSTLATNGAVPDLTMYESQAVPVGEAHFWVIGRPGDYQVQPDEVFFGLVDEAGKINLNTAGTNLLQGITNMLPELAANIVDWRSTNGTVSTYGDGPAVYSSFQPGYQAKNAPYETVDELRLVYPMSLGTLVGEDLNRNGALDPVEANTNGTGYVDSGLLDYSTVYSREPNAAPDGAARTDIQNLNTTTARSLLQTNLTAARLTQVLLNLGLMSMTPARGRGGATATAASLTATFSSPLQFYIRSGMTADEFAPIADHITVATGNYISGRININTAPAAVLGCLPGMSSDSVQQIITYRQQNPDQLTSITWLVAALGQNSAALRTLAAGDYITTHSYQFTADIAALGPFGRGYRRVKFVFDTSSGNPQIVYRQDLTHLGWALGRYVRHDYLAAR
jgi:type II secretory pathway component PulK